MALIDGDLASRHRIGDRGVVRFRQPPTSVLPRTGSSARLDSDSNGDFDGDANVGRRVDFSSRRKAEVRSRLPLRRLCRSTGGCSRYRRRRGPCVGRRCRRRGIRPLLRAAPRAPDQRLPRLCLPHGKRARRPGFGENNGLRLAVGLDSAVQLSLAFAMKGAPSTEVEGIVRAGSAGQSGTPVCQRTSGAHSMRLHSHRRISRPDRPAAVYGTGSRRCEQRLGSRSWAPPLQQGPSA